MSWVYRSVTGYSSEKTARRESTRFDVGYLSTEHPTNLPVEERFNVVETYANKDDARQAVHYLNGGGMMT